MPPKGWGGGRGGRGEQDWNCSQCGNSNYGWREQCNRCPQKKESNKSGDSGGADAVRSKHVLKFPPTREDSGPGSEEDAGRSRGAAGEDARAAIARKRSRTDQGGGDDDGGSDPAGGGAAASSSTTASAAASAATANSKLASELRELREAVASAHAQLAQRDDELLQLKQQDGRLRQQLADAERDLVRAPASTSGRVFTWT